VAILIPLIGFWYQTAMAGSPISGAKDDVAIQGFDTVAYFTEAKAVKGSPRLAHEWAGTVWFFATIENRDAFASQPEKYAPQYGGHCALSVANGKDAKGSGEAWHLHQGVLYLNASNNVQARWLRDVSGNISRADQQWPSIKARLEAE
jgi:YHS domain-containing protein